MRTAFWLATLMGGLSCMTVQAADSKPLGELPSDLATWSTLWMELPKQMYGVGQEEGPLSAMTWGSVRGTVKLVDATSKAVWAAAKRDSRPGRDAILRYEF